MPASRGAELIITSKSHVAKHGETRTVKKVEALDYSGGRGGHSNATYLLLAWISMKFLNAPCRAFSFLVGSTHLDGETSCQPR